MTNHENNRVLNRIGARDLTSKETELVNGGSGPHTTTLCTFNEDTRKPDGDAGECV
jgi:hypothetical protein